MNITDRKLALLNNVRRYRLLSSAHLCALDGGNRSNVLADLRELFDSGLLDRPIAQLATMPLYGPQPMVYGLTTKGARLLRQHGHRIDAGLGWTDKTKRAGAIFFDHTLAIADFLVQVEIACRQSAGIEIIGEAEILAEAPAETRSAREPLRWQVETVIMGRRETLSVIPDGLFGLSFPDNTAVYFLLEIDRGTIPIARSAPTHRSITRKLSTYLEGWRAGRHVKQFGLSNVRVLTLTNTQARMENMLAAVDAITVNKGTGFLLFGNAESLAGQGPLEFNWTNGRRERVRLID